MGLHVDNQYQLIRQFILSNRLLSSQSIFAISGWNITSASSVFHDRRESKIFLCISPRFLCRQHRIVMGSKETTTEISTPTLDSSESASSALIKFLDLPIRFRDRVYERVLIVPHPLYLFQEPGSPVETFAPDKPLHWLALLHTNRQISVEAGAALYRVNHFELVDITKRQFSVLRSFLDCIGPVNAASLSHLCISFPIVESIDEEPGNLRLRDDSLQSLKLLQDKCTNLSTLETVVHYKNSDSFTKTDQFLREAFSQIDVQLKTIHSLRRIIVRVDAQRGIPTSSVKDMMRRLRWLVLSGNGN